MQPKYSANLIITKGVVIDPITSNLYVCDVFSGITKVFSYDLLFTFADASLGRPRGICISHDKVFITDMYASVICVFTLEGYIVSKYFITSKKSYLSLSRSVAVDRNGDIYTCDEGNRILVLTHDGCKHFYFARSSLKSPRDVKLHQDNVIVLDTFNPTGTFMNHLLWLKVYSKNEELLKVTQVDDVNCQSFDVTSNSNYLISSVSQIYFVSKNGKVLKKLGTDNIPKNMNQSRIVLDNKTKESIGLHIYQGNMLWFVDS